MNSEPLTSSLTIRERINRWQLTVYYYSIALAVARKIGGRHSVGKFLDKLGDAYYSQGQLDQAVDYHEQALVMARENRDRPWEDKLLVDLGFAYSVMGQSERAIDYHEQTVVIAQENDDRQGEGSACSNSGEIFGLLAKNTPPAAIPNTQIAPSSPGSVLTSFIQPASTSIR